MTEAEEIERKTSPGGLAFAAFVGNVLVPGLGFMLSGRTRLALFAALAPVLILLAFGWSRLVMTPIGYWVAIATAIIVIAGLATYAARLVWRAYEPGSIHRRRWRIALFAVGVIVMSNLVFEYRGSILGYLTYRIPASSMANTLNEGDFFLADTRAYRNAEPEFGDIVVFTSPESGVNFVKRVVGLPGEHLAIVGGIAVRDGIEMTEPWANFESRPPREYGTYLDLEIPEGHYFVLGDSRNNSMDSRVFGPIPADAIDGKAVHRFFPDFHVFPDQE